MEVKESSRIGDCVRRVFLRPALEVKVRLLKMGQIQFQIWHQTETECRASAVGQPDRRHTLSSAGCNFGIVLESLLQRVDIEFFFYDNGLNHELASHMQATRRVFTRHTRHGWLHRGGKGGTYHMQ